jgi:hypothetical protein
MSSRFWSGAGKRYRAAIDATRSGARGFAEGWRAKLTVALAFATAVVIGLLVAVTIGGMLAGFVE